MFRRRRTTHQFHELTSRLASYDGHPENKGKVGGLGSGTDEVESRKNMDSSAKIINIKDLAKRVEITVEDVKTMQFAHFDGKFQQTGQIASSEQNSKMPENEQNQQKQPKETIQSPQIERVRVYLNNKLVNQHQWMSQYMKEQSEEETEDDTLGDYQTYNQVIFDDQHENLLFLDRENGELSSDEDSDFWDNLEAQQTIKSSEKVSQLNQTKLQSKPSQTGIKDDDDILLK